MSNCGGDVIRGLMIQPTVSKLRRKMLSHSLSSQSHHLTMLQQWNMHTCTIQQGDTRPGDMWPSWLITGYILSQNEAFPSVKCIRRYVQNGSVITWVSWVLVWRKWIHFRRRYERKTTLHFPSKWSWPFDFRITLPINNVRKEG